MDIPVNSESIYVRDNVSRFRGAPWFRTMENTDIAIVGLGGIGSFSALFLSRCFPYKILLYDNDYVDPSNMSGQFYGKDHMRMLKTRATAANMKEFSNYYLYDYSLSNFDSNSTLYPITIGCVDNMKTRKDIFNNWVSKYKGVPYALLLDGRLAAEKFQIFCMRGEDEENIERYSKEWLFSDEEADPTICSYKQTSYAAGMIGSFITNLVVNFVSNISPDTEFHIERSLPFMTLYEADLMIFKAVD